jgi:hypothetical protein
LEYFRLNATQEVRAQPCVKFLDLLLRQFFVFLGKGLKVTPLGRIQKVHQIKQLADVVVQRRLRWISSASHDEAIQATYSGENDAMQNLEFF